MGLSPLHSHLIVTLASEFRDLELYECRNFGSKRFSDLPEITHFEFVVGRFELIQTVSGAHILNI